MRRLSLQISTFVGEGNESFIRVREGSDKKIHMYNVLVIVYILRKRGQRRHRDYSYFMDVVEMTAHLNDLKFHLLCVIRLCIVYQGHCGLIISL